MAYDPWVVQPKSNKPKSPPPPSGGPSSPWDPAVTTPDQPYSEFDYRSNPYYQQALAAVNAGGAADAANSRAAIQQALIGFGFVPTGFNDKLGALDDLTKSLIQKNTDTGISGYARLLEGRSEGVKGLINRLQARGLRRSGARGAGLKKNQLGFDRNFADAVANLLGQTGSVYSSYAQNEAARQSQLADAMRWVYQNYYTPPSGGYSGVLPQGGDYGGYVPGSMQITDYGTPQWFDIGGGRQAS